MKRTAFAVISALTLALGLTACGASTAETTAAGSAAETTAAESSAATEAQSEAASESDMEYVKDKGTLVIGITDFEPMDYKDADGKWIGFDADMAAAFAKSIGVEPEFVEIDWDNKILELDGKTIDCVWNGMTLTDEVKSSMSTSNACNILISSRPSIRFNAAPMAANKQLSRRLIVLYLISSAADMAIYMIKQICIGMYPVTASCV